MKPKPRSAFHIFKVPVAIALFSLFEPELDQAADGLGALRFVILLAAPVIDLFQMIILPARADLRAFSGGHRPASLFSGILN
jgi:hypothetical protein